MANDSPRQNQVRDSSEARRGTPFDSNVTSEHGTNHVHGLEETPFQHVTLEPGQTKRYGAARPCTVPPRSYVEGVGAMGRGRQKAKQTKVARELKYYSPDTNYHALEQELSRASHTDVATQSRWEAPEDEEYDNRYSDWAEQDGNTR